MTCIDHGRTRSLTHGMYAQVHLKKVKPYQRDLLHRVVYCNAHQLPLTAIKGKVVRHTCDNGRCINPDHLILGTQADNIRDMVERGRCLTSNPKIRKLTMQDATDIRARYDPTLVGRCRPNGLNALGKLYNVDHATIRKIVYGSTYYEKEEIV